METRISSAWNIRASISNIGSPLFAEMAAPISTRIFRIVCGLAGWAPIRPPVTVAPSLSAAAATPRRPAARRPPGGAPRARGAPAPSTGSSPAPSAADVGELPSRRSSSSRNIHPRWYRGSRSAA